MEETEYAGLTLEVQDLVEQGGPTTVTTVVGVEHTAIKIIDNEGKFMMILSVPYTCKNYDNIILFFWPFVCLTAALSHIIDIIANGNTIYGHIHLVLFHMYVYHQKWLI